MIAQSAGTVQYTDCRGVRPPPPPTSVLLYDTKQSDGELWGMLSTGVLELWGMLSTPSLPSLPGPL